jgi:hypothetical protein
MALTRRLGDYITRIKYYGYYIHLYVVTNKFVEVYYNRFTKEIQEIEIIDPLDKRLNLYAAEVSLADLFKKNAK